MASETCDGHGPNWDLSGSNWCGKMLGMEFDAVVGLVLNIWIFRMVLLKFCHSLKCAHFIQVAGRTCEEVARTAGSHLQATTVHGQHHEEPPVPRVSTGPLDNMRLAMNNEAWVAT